MEITREEMIAAFGSAEQVHAELESFGRTSQALSRRWPELVELYDGKWIAAHDCEITGVADTHEELIVQLESKGFSRGSAVVRHIERNPMTMIL